MMMKSIVAGLAGTALLATVAFAQSPSTNNSNTMAPNAKSSAPAAAPAAPTGKMAAPAAPTGNTAATATSTQSAQGEWRTSKVVGLKVYNDKNENVGSINDLLMDESGKIKQVVIGVGGFLGMGERLVAVPFEKIKFSNQPVPYTGVAANKATSTSRPAPTTSTTTGAATNTNNAVTTKSSSSKWYPDHAVYNVDKNEVKKMPEFKYSE